MKKQISTRLLHLLSLSRGLIANGSVPRVFYVAAGTNQTLRYVSPFAQSFILNWIAVEP